MNKHFYTLTGIVLIIGLLISPALGASKKMQKNQGAVSIQTGTSSVIASLPYEELSADEELSLIKMREEEKLARDVYATLYDVWKAPVFNNISQGEQRHMNSIKVLTDKYGLIDPISDSTVGVFTDPLFTGLYASLVEKGSASLLDALIVGAAIEDLDIYDLDEFLAQTDNEDITAVYENLLKGSRNHMRSFTYQLSLNGATYTAQYISQEELDAIITSPREIGTQAGKQSTSRTGGSGDGTGDCVNR